MKRFGTLLLVVSTMISLAMPANAGANGKTIAIVDYTFDTTVSPVKDKALADLCFSITKSCASVPKDQIYSNDLLVHGTIMASVAAMVDPTMKFIFIRVGNINPKTYSVSKMSTTEFDNVLIPVFDWLIQNSSKYNISAVSTSMSHTSFSNTGSYCPIKKSASYPGTLQDRIVKLQNIGIASIFSAGNTYDPIRASYPACIKEAIAIGATEERESTGLIPASLKSAKGPDVDFYALGTYQLPFTRMTGQTSPAAAAFATYWAKQYQRDFQSTLNYINGVTSDVYFGLTKTYSRQFVDVFK